MATCPATFEQKTKLHLRALLHSIWSRKFIREKIERRDEEDYLKLEAEAEKKRKAAAEAYESENTTSKTKKKKTPSQNHF